MQGNNGDSPFLSLYKDDLAIIFIVRLRQFAGRFGYGKTKSKVVGNTLYF